MSASAPALLARAETELHGVRALMRARVGTTDGWCELASHLLAARLLDTPGVTLCHGEVDGGEHWWLHAGGLRLDPTADQFADAFELSLVGAEDDADERDCYLLVSEHAAERERVVAGLERLAALYEGAAARGWPKLGQLAALAREALAELAC